MFKRFTLRFIVPNIIQLLALAIGLGLVYLVSLTSFNADIESLEVFALFAFAFSLCFQAMSIIIYCQNRKYIKEKRPNLIKENVISMAGVGGVCCVLLIAVTSMLIMEGFFAELVLLRWILIPVVLVFNMIIGTLAAKIYTSEKVTNFISSSGSASKLKAIALHAVFYLICLLVSIVTVILLYFIALCSIGI